MHEFTQLAFHEGLLWDDSSAEARARWLQQAKLSSLTPASASALSDLEQASELVQPCRDAERWLELVNPTAVSTSCTKRVTERDDDLDVR